MNLNLSVVLGKRFNNKKKEGDKKTPKGIFKIENLYFRKDRKKTINFIEMYRNKKKYGLV